MGTPRYEATRLGSIRIYALSDIAIGPCRNFDSPERFRPPDVTDGRRRGWRWNGWQKRSPLLLVLTRPRSPSPRAVSCRCRFCWDTFFPVRSLSTTQTRAQCHDSEEFNLAPIFPHGEPSMQRTDTSAVGSRSPVAPTPTCVQLGPDSAYRGGQFCTLHTYLMTASTNRRAYATLYRTFEDALIAAVLWRCKLPPWMSHHGKGCLPATAALAASSSSSSSSFARRERMNKKTTSRRPGGRRRRKGARLRRARK